jgi:hypothetical protein
LIVGDFAGVENEFSCNNIVTIRDFLNIKKNEKETYYGGYATNDYKNNAREIIKKYVHYIQDKKKDINIFKDMIRILTGNPSDDHLKSYIDFIGKNLNKLDELVNLRNADILTDILEKYENSISTNDDAFKKEFSIYNKKKYDFTDIIDKINKIYSQSNDV